MPDVKIKGYSGAELEFKDVPKVWLAAPESTQENPVLVPFTYGEAVEGVEVTPDFSEGDMNITLEEGLLAKSAVIKKPEGLIPENIKKDTSVAGIVGEYEGDTVETEAITVAADFSGGDMVVEPSGRKLLEKATITKPETLIPDNIAEGVVIAGIEGIFKGGTTRNAPVVFLKYNAATARYLQSVTSASAVVIAKIPSNAVLMLDPLIGKAVIKSSVNTSELFPVPTSLSKGTCTITDNGDYKNYQYTYSLTGQGTQYYKNVTAMLVLIYYVPGLDIRSEDDGTLTLIGSSELTYSSVLEAIPSGYKLTAAELQNSALNKLPESFFAGQTNLKHITLPNALQSISNRAFYNAYALESVDIPGGVRSIGSYAFYGCKKLVEIEIPSAVTTIYSYAFSQCTSLLKVTLPEGLASIGSNAFSSCTALKEIELPASITTIDSNAFSSCSSLESVEIPVGVTTIGSYAFSSCNSLIEISIPEGVTTVSAYLCYNCIALKKVVLPKGITTIDMYAFENCSALEMLDCSLCESVPTINYTALSNTLSTMQIHVPAALYDTWKTTSGWSSYSNRIVAV